MTTGSVSPSKGRARSTGPVHSVRRSRADTAHKPPATGESSTLTTRPSAPAAAAAEAPSATSQRLSRVKSMPSKLNADQKASNVSTTPTASVPAARGRTPPAKRPTKSTQPSQATTPTSSSATTPGAGKAMPNAPKPMAPRAVPKEPKAMKEVTTNKPITSHKVWLLTYLLTYCFHIY